MKILLAQPRGFCAGVDRAIAIVERALETIGPPIYVRHEVVHNRFVVEDLKQRGAIFVEECDEIPEGATVIFSAHGVSQQVRDQAKHRHFEIFDATCPLVTKVHMEVIRFAKQAKECILIGHQGHPEVEGTLGQYHNPEGAIYLVETEQDVAQLTVKDPDNLAYVTQTTLSVDDTQKIINALKQKYPTIQGPKKDDICYATQNRQDAVKELAKHSDLILVVGSPNSSNSNRLKELATRANIESYLLDNTNQIDSSWLKNKSVIGITAGASAPETLVQSVVNKLKTLGATEVSTLNGVEETITFALPKELRDKQVYSTES